MTLLIRIIVLLLLWVGSSCHAASTLILDLDTLEQRNLTPGSAVIIDAEQSASPEAILNSAHWETLDREQLRYGRSVKDAWLKHHFRTTGTAERRVTLAVYRLVSHTRYWLYKDGKLTDTGSMSSRDHKGVLKSNPNVTQLRLAPNHDYILLLKAKNNNVLIGSVHLLETAKEKANNRLVLYSTLAYAIFIIAISIYNIFAFIATQQKAFLLHAFYVLNVLIVQLFEFNYAPYFFPELNNTQLDQILVIVICTAYIFIVLFIGSLLDHKTHDPLFYYIDRVVLSCALLNLLSVPFVSYLTSITLITYNILGYTLIGLFYLIRSAIIKNTQAWIAAAIFLIFAPSAAGVFLGRLGFINVSALQYGMYLSLIMETIFVLYLLSKRLQSMRFELRQALYFDKASGLPNKESLLIEMQSYFEKKPPFMLTYIWLSGLERVEAAFGADFKNAYQLDLIHHLQTELNHNARIKSAGKTQQKLYLPSMSKFAVISDDMDSGQLAELHKTIQTCIRQTNQRHRSNLEINAVVAGCRNEHHDMKHLLENVSFALSYCIRCHRDSLIYEESVGEQERKTLALTHEFVQSLVRNEFFLHWQPQFNGRQQLVGLEALVRWRHPRFGVISPVEFIPLLENTLQIKDLTRWVISQALSTLDELHSSLPGVDISINLSAHDLIDPTFMPFIRQQLQQYPHAAKWVTLEITESVMLEEDQTVVDVVRSLQQMGLSISIDDFGAGFASFGYLQSLPVDELKIDKRYVDAWDQGNSQAIICSIIALAKRLKVQVVAEGIEQQSQADCLLGWDVDRLQGWWLGKPMSMESILNHFPPRTWPQAPEKPTHASGSSSVSGHLGLG